LGYFLFNNPLATSFAFVLTLDRRWPLAIVACDPRNDDLQHFKFGGFLEHPLADIASVGTTETIEIRQRWPVPEAKA
jgi:hypothetical protein